MSSCDHNCSSCGQSCNERDKESLLAPAHPQSNVKKIIAVVSGKGGVGKSLVTTLLAAQMNKDGFKTAILDADITGPSIPTAFGVTERISGNDMGMLPAVSKKGISMMSVNLLLEHATDPIIWRGVIIANTVKQFWSDTIWGNVDYMFVDMPPGTGDVPLTVFQS
ncbi:MAG: Mrp/NBP35 family ATP-binding protein, partial [Mailhella sp.]|nr:Mrp/NBP35 family ATP-binding protein [Mailhella sp.]